MADAREQHPAAGANGVFVMVEPEQPSAILAYYTLAATSLRPGEVPDAARPHIPRDPLVSAALIGRSRSRLTGKGSGSARRSWPMRSSAPMPAATVGSTMIVVDALNERAAASCMAHHFIPLADPLRLALPMRLVPRYFVRTTP